MGIRTISGQLKPIEWIKFKIAYLLDRNPNLCWANLATWATGYSSFWETFNPDDGAAYRQDCPRLDSYAYCGKCEVLGKMIKSNK